MNKNDKLGSYLEAKIAKLNQKSNSEITPAEIENFIKLSNREVVNRLECPVGVETYSIEEFPEILESEFLANEKDQPNSKVEQAEIIDYLKENFMKSLKFRQNKAERYSKVIALWYGVGQDKEYTISEIAEKLNLKESIIVGMLGKSKHHLRILGYYFHKKDYF